MNVGLVDVVDLVGIAATVETVKADTDDVRWGTQRKVALLENSPLHSAAVSAGVVVLLPRKSLTVPLIQRPRGIARAAG